MKLEDQLRIFNQKARANLSPETLSTMAKATRDLAASGIVDGALAKGETMPAFSLPDIHGRPVTSQQLLSKGPLVISFYRGSW